METATESDAPITDEEVDALIGQRTAARKAKNFKESDRIRDLLTAKGIVIEDGPAGTKWGRR